MTPFPTPQPLHPPVTVRVFARRFAATLLGAHRARKATVQRLHAWGVPHGTDLSDTAALLVAELAANAVTHGHVPGRTHELRLSLAPHLLRIDVTDHRADRTPRPGATAPPPGACSGRGLVLVDALADRWAVLDRPPDRKAVRAELDLPR